MTEGSSTAPKGAAITDYAASVLLDLIADLRERAHRPDGAPDAWCPPEASRALAIGHVHRAAWATLEALYGCSVSAHAALECLIRACSLPSRADGRADLCRALINGRPLDDRQRAMVARSGLTGDGGMIVLRGHFTADPSWSHRALVVDSAEETLAVIGIEHNDRQRLATGLRTSASKTGALLAASAVAHSVAEVPQAYAEAGEALALSRRLGAPILLFDLTLFDYLPLADTEAVAKLVPANLRRFVEEDQATGGTLIETLAAYAAADLSPTTSARHLGCHPNTVHYRLTQIERRTGLDVRKFTGATEALLSVRLLTAGLSTPDGCAVA